GRSSRHSGRLGRTYTEFLRARAPTRASRWRTFARRYRGRGGSWWTSRYQRPGDGLTQVCISQLRCHLSTALYDGAQGTAPDRIRARTLPSMFPPETTQTVFPPPARPESAAATGAAPAPSLTTCARSASRRTAAAT